MAAEIQGKLANAGDAKRETACPADFKVDGGSFIPKIFNDRLDIFLFSMSFSSHELGNASRLVGQ